MTTALSLLFAGLLLVVIAWRYLGPKRQRCPQCLSPRDEEHPLCRECGWIYETDEDESDGEYVEPEEIENWR